MDFLETMAEISQACDDERKEIREMSECFGRNPKRYQLAASYVSGKMNDEFIERNCANNKSHQHAPFASANASTKPPHRDGFLTHDGSRYDVDLARNTLNRIDTVKYG